MLVNHTIGYWRRAYTFLKYYYVLTRGTAILNNTNKLLNRAKSSRGYLMNQLIQKLEALSLDRITLDHEIQPRQQLNQEVVAEYAEAMKRGLRSHQ